MRYMNTTKAKCKVRDTIPPIAYLDTDTQAGFANTTKVTGKITNLPSLVI